MPPEASRSAIFILQGLTQVPGLKPSFANIHANKANMTANSAKMFSLAQVSAVILLTGFQLTSQRFGKMHHALHTSLFALAYLQPIYLNTQSWGISLTSSISHLKARNTRYKRLHYDDDSTPDTQRKIYPCYQPGTGIKGHDKKTCQASFD